MSRLSVAILCRALAIAASQEFTISTGATRFLLAFVVCTRVTSHLGVLLMADPHKSAIDAYLSEMSALAAKRFEVNKRIARLEQVIGGMIDLLDSEAEQMSYTSKLYDVMTPLSLTTAIEKILESEKKAFTPKEVRDRVEDYLLTHSNPMASVHTILKRLVKTGWVESFKKDGGTYYRYLNLPEQHLRDNAKRLGIPMQQLERIRRRHGAKSK
jgi:predicted transcriptional regulator